MKKIYSLLLFFIILFNVEAQDPYSNLQKYQYFRERLRNDFMIVDETNRQGTNIPAGSRNSYGSMLDYGENPMIGSICPYLMLLSTEYAINKKYNYDNTRTLNELSYLLLAIERLDLNAEKFFRADANDIDPKDPNFWQKVDNYIEPNDLNGFFLRNDVDSRAKTEKFRKYYEDATRYIYNYNNDQLKYVDYYQGTIDLSSCVFNESLDGETGVATNDRAVMSQDEVWFLYLGLAMVAKLVDNEQKFYDIQKNQVTIRQWVAEITYRVQLALSIVDAPLPSALEPANWQIINPYTEEIVTDKNGGWTYGNSGLFCKSAINIISTCGNTPDILHYLNILNQTYDVGFYLSYFALYSVLLDVSLKNYSNPSQFEFGLYNLKLISFGGLNYYIRLMKKSTNAANQINYEYYPLLWRALKDSSLVQNWKKLDDFITYDQYKDSIKMLLDVMPACGSYKAKSSGKVSDSYWYSSRFRHYVNRVSPNNFCDVVSDGFTINSCIDYMVLFNLYYLYMADDLNVYEDQKLTWANQNYPTSSNYGSNSNPATIYGPIFEMSHTINSTANVNIIASKYIRLLPGFSVKTGGRFTARIGINTPNCLFENKDGNYCPKQKSDSLESGDYYVISDSADNFINLDNDNIYKIGSTSEENKIYFNNPNDTLPEFCIYPNPVSNILNLEISNSNKVDRIILIDLNGKVLKVIEQVKNSENIDFSNFSEGVYLLIFESQGQKYSKTIIKN